MIRDLLQDKSYEIIFSSDGGKNIDFFNAGKKLIETCTNHESKYGVLWLEDDWEPKSKYDINKFFTLFNYQNASYTCSNDAPLGSFRGGPFMTGSYFKNIFNIFSKAFSFICLDHQIKNTIVTIIKLKSNKK